MTWFKVDDNLHSHNKVRKVLAEEPAALALWTVAGSWSSDNLTDGLIPDHQLPWLMPSRAEELARMLVTVGLWRRAKGGYQFHQWTADGDGTKRNPTREEVENERRRKAEAGRKGGLASGKARSNSEAPAEPSAKAGASRLVEPPTRPDPVTTKTSSSPAAPATDEDFERFWATYPRRIGKGQARKAWATAIKRGTDPERIIEAAGRFTAARGNQDPKFTPHPSTWLNGERWGDAPEAEPPREAGPVMPWDLWP